MDLVQKNQASDKQENRSSNSEAAICSKRNSQEFEKSLEALAAVAKDLGKAVCLEEREASKSRRKSLKAALKTLQDARTGPEAKQQLLVKLLATQADDLTRLERSRIQLQQDLKQTEKRCQAAEEELAKKQALSNTLQGLSRALQSQNNNLSQQLEDHLSRRHEDSKQSTDLQKAVADITTRLDMEKDKLGQLQEAAAQNVALREQNLAMARRIELQQELALKEEALQAGVKELVQKQQAEEKRFRDEVSEAMDKLLQQNTDLRDQCQRQEKLLRQQTQQIQDCSQAMTAAREGYREYQKSFSSSKAKIETLTSELEQKKTEYKDLQARLGTNVQEGATKLLSRNQALEGLCRALQDQVRKSAETPQQTDIAETPCLVESP